MDKKNILEWARYGVIIVVLYVCAWGVAKILADSVSDYEVIQPKDGVECVVVSRMFNTSVDCWATL